MTENIHWHCVMLEEQLYEIKPVFVSYTLKPLSNDNYYCVNAIVICIHRNLAACNLALP